MLDGAADKDLVSKQTDEMEEGEQNERRARLGRWRHRDLAADVTAGLKKLRGVELIFHLSQGR